MHGRSDTPSVMDTIHSGIVFSDFEKWGLIRVLQKTGGNNRKMHVLILVSLTKTIIQFET